MKKTNEPGNVPAAQLTGCLATWRHPNERDEQT